MTRTTAPAAAHPSHLAVGPCQPPAQQPHTTVTQGAHLLRMLDQVLPHMSTETDDPMLNCIHLEVRDQWLFATATDRYTMAVARTHTADTDSWQALIAAAHIPAVHELLIAAKDKSDLVTLSVAADGRQVTISSSVMGNSMTMSAPALAPNGYPDWRRVLCKVLDTTPQPTRLTTLRTEYLARWGDASPYLRCWQSAPDSPLVLMDGAGRFLGLQSPRRSDATSLDDLLSKWRSTLTRFAYTNGARYNLDLPMADRHGDLWEYSGRDQPSGDPLMRLASVGGEELVEPLSYLITQYGPMRETVR
ncbi:phiSA1p31-related protein [Streptomyces uncialis]|uniref:phiSA1p31-related protein n=1 Tax=Streptomyces uncialis TaxID=1048205 RepID=UPI0037FE0863